MTAGDRWEFAAAVDVVMPSSRRRIYLTTKSGVTGSDIAAASAAMPLAKKIANQAWDALVVSGGKGAVKIPPLQTGVLCRTWIDSSVRDNRSLQYNFNLGAGSKCISTRDYNRWSYECSLDLAVTVGPTGDTTEDRLWPTMWVVQDGHVIRRAVIDLEPIEWHTSTRSFFAK